MTRRSEHLSCVCGGRPDLRIRAARSLIEQYEAQLEAEYARYKEQMEKHTGIAYVPF